MCRSNYSGYGIYYCCIQPQSHVKETHAGKMADPSQDMQDILSQFGLSEIPFDDSQHAQVVNALEIETDRGNHSPRGGNQSWQLTDEGLEGRPMTQFQLFVERDSLRPSDPQLASSDREIAVQSHKRKQQNCTAARKYRAKKKEMEKSLKDDLSSLKSKNIALIREKEQLTASVKYLRQLLKDHAHCHVSPPLPVHCQHTTR
ncbi:uncharacterized protein LOC135468458 [Liolophura sinensis]|uniref:uncharacterized protein LOC135468458 n=1 Tax=Liolophura sinensis TaxID=3198878 RepID=UPI00315843F9